MIIMYLMFFKRMSYDDALNHVKQRREIVKPNEGFTDQMRKWQHRFNSGPEDPGIFYRLL